MSRKMCFVLFFCAILLYPSAAHAKTPYLQFAYVAEAKTAGGYYLSLFDPENPNEYNGLFLSLENPKASPFRVQASPDGKKVGLVTISSYNGDTEIYIIDVSTGAISPPIPFVMKRPAELSIQAFPVIKWSPNSRYLAFNTTNVQSQYESSTLEIYNVESRTLEYVATDAPDEYDFTWSPDSRYLAFVQASCDSRRFKCEISIDRLDMMTKQHEQLANFSSDDFLVYVSDAICELDWSPSGKYISYKNNCEGAIGGPSFRTISAIDTTTKSKTTVVNLHGYSSLSAQQKQVLPTAYADMSGVDYTSFWGSNDILFVAASSYDNQGFSTVSQQYSVGLNQPTITLGAFFVEEWSKNPMTGQLALRVAKSPPEDWKPSYNMQIATIQNNQLTIQKTLPPGYRPRWSPDGKYLVYLREPCKDCANDHDAFMLVESVTGAYQIPKLLPNQDHFMGAGWVYAPYFTAGG